MRRQNKAEGSPARKVSKKEGEKSKPFVTEDLRTKMGCKIGNKLPGLDWVEGIRRTPFKGTEGESHNSRDSMRDQNEDSRW